MGVGLRGGVAQGRVLQLMPHCTNSGLFPQEFQHAFELALRPRDVAVDAIDCPQRRTRAHSLEERKAN